MCERPYKIKFKTNGLGRIYRPMSYYDSLEVQKMDGKEIEVPCRRCAECLKQRADDYTQYLVEVLRNMNGKTAFRTLTYNDEQIPLAHSIAIPKCTILPKGKKLRELFDSHGKLIGYKRETLDWEVLESVDGEDFVPDYQVVHIDNITYKCEKFKYLNGTNTPTLCDNLTQEGFPQYLTASLCRSDFSLCMKRARMQYERKYGKKSDCKFFCVGEYGTKTGRPHYHVLFMNVDKEFLAIFEKLWQELYGYTYSSKQQLRNGGFVVGDPAGVAAYISKYMSKGSFDYPYLDYVERPRMMCSINLLKFDSHRIMFCRGYDWLKEHGLFDVSTSLWSENERNEYYDLIIGRNSFSYIKNNVMKSSAFKNHLKRLVWLDSYECECPVYNEELNEYEWKIKRICAKNVLSYIGSDIARMRNMEVLLRQLGLFDKWKTAGLSCEEEDRLQKYCVAQTQGNKIALETQLREFLTNKSVL